MQAALGKIGVGPSKVLHDLSGRTALVTGGAMGIGYDNPSTATVSPTTNLTLDEYRYEVAKAFASVHARVIMVNRKEDQGSAAIKAIKEEMGPNTNVEWVHCDFGNLKEIQKVFSGIRDKEERLDIVSSLPLVPRNVEMTVSDCRVHI